MELDMRANHNVANLESKRSKTHLFRNLQSRASKTHLFLNAVALLGQRLTHLVSTASERGRDEAQDDGVVERVGVADECPAAGADVESHAREPRRQ